MRKEKLLTSRTQAISGNIYMYGQIKKFLVSRPSAHQFWRAHQENLFLSHPLALTMQPLKYWILNEAHLPVNYSSTAPHHPTPLCKTRTLHTPQYTCREERN